MYLRLENNYGTCDRKVDSARWEESNAEDLFRNASDPDDQFTDGLFRFEKRMK